MITYHGLWVPIDIILMKCVMLFEKNSPHYRISVSLAGRTQYLIIMYLNGEMMLFLVDLTINMLKIA